MLRTLLNIPSWPGLFSQTQRSVKVVELDLRYDFMFRRITLTQIYIYPEEVILRVTET